MSRNYQNFNTRGSVCNGFPEGCNTRRKALFILAKGLIYATPILNLFTAFQQLSRHRRGNKPLSASPGLMKTIACLNMLSTPLRKFVVN
jgi:hypothetical protein